MATTSTPEELALLPPEYLAEDIHQKLLNASVSFIAITTVTYILFNVSRLVFSERNGWEIWTLYPISYVFSIVLCILCILFVRIGGAGRHTAYWLLNDPTVVETFLKLQTATEFVYMAGVTFPKISILMLYVRIFVERKVRIITWIVMGIVLTNFIATGIIATFTICQPFAYKWDKTIPGGSCANLMAAYRYISIPNILTDLAIIALPFSTLYHLQTSRTRKVGIFITFMTGGMGIITAVIRFIGFYTVNLESDPTYLGINTEIFTTIEPNAYFICSCLPGMRPLLRGLYRASGLGATVNRLYHHMSNTSSNSRAIKDGTCEYPLGNPKGRTKTSVSAPKGLQGCSDSNDHAPFIRLDETVDIHYTTSRISRGSSA